MHNYARKKQQLQPAFAKTKPANLFSLKIFFENKTYCTLNHKPGLFGAKTTSYSYYKAHAEMSEWFKVQPWKGCVRETVPRVQISFSAPKKRQTILWSVFLENRFGRVVFVRNGNTAKNLFFCDKR